MFCELLTAQVKFLTARTNSVANNPIVINHLIAPTLNTFTTDIMYALDVDYH